MKRRLRVKKLKKYLSSDNENEEYLKLLDKFSEREEITEDADGNIFYGSVYMSDKEKVRLNHLEDKIFNAARELYCLQNRTNEAPF